MKAKNTAMAMLALTAASMMPDIKPDFMGEATTKVPHVRPKTKLNNKQKKQRAKNKAARKSRKNNR